MLFLGLQKRVSPSELSFWCASVLWYRREMADEDEADSLG